MRVFDTLHDAALEIKRDLAKSPVVESSRVQQFRVSASAREAMVYDYTIRQFPEDVDVLSEQAVQLGFWQVEEVPEMKEWIRREEQARLYWDAGLITEVLHPDLVKTLEGSEPAYTYTDRLSGSIETLTRLLEKSPDTRRGFWPIFNREDAVRSIRDTRIPCSLGYQVLIRMVGTIPYLHLVYLERSCDFDRFWLSDLWLARKFQTAVYRRLTEYVSPGTPPENTDIFSRMKLGHLSHVVVSLHSFIDEEVY